MYLRVKFNYSLVEVVLVVVNIYYPQILVRMKTVFNLNHVLNAEIWHEQLK